MNMSRGSGYASIVSEFMMRVGDVGMMAFFGTLIHQQIVEAIA
jgi:hypothetical protein